MPEFVDAARTVPRSLPAYILGIEHPRGIACVRSLAERGVPVVGIDYQLSPASAYCTSRYVERRALIDPTAADSIDALEKLAGSRGGVLIPTSDEYLILTARNHERLSRTFRLAGPSWEKLEPVMDRVRSVELAKKAGLPTAPSFHPKDERALDEVLALLDFGEQRYVLKLELWTDSIADTKQHRKTTYGGASSTELRRRVLEIAERTGEFPTIQELVPGATDMSLGVTMVVDRDGEPCLAYCVRRLKLQTYSRADDFRHPYDLGGNVFCETVHEPEALVLARRFVRALQWTGAITVEFRRDLRDGSLKFVKIDPRVVRATSLSAAIGMDVPAAIYDVAIGRTPPRVEGYPTGVCWIWLDKYLESLWRSRRQAAARRELTGLLGRARDIKGFAFWSPREPLPFLAHLVLRLALRRRWVQPKRFAERPGLRVASSTGGGQEVGARRGDATSPLQ